MVQSHIHSPAPQAVTPSERDAWRKDILSAAFQGGVTSDFWLEALLDRVEARR
jgi:hypothetical protein